MSIIKTRKIRFKKKYKIIFLTFLIVFSLLILGISFRKNKDDSIEKKINNSVPLRDMFLNLVDDYYNNILKDKIINIERYIITIESLEKAGYNVSELISLETKNSCDKEKTYAEIKIGNPQEKNKDLINYHIDIYLDCDN